MRLPEPRGPLSEFLVDTLTGTTTLDVPDHSHDDALAGDDLHLALYLCYELHYDSFEGVAPEWEWEPEIIGFRRSLERAFEEALLDLAPPPVVEAGDATEALLEVIRNDDGPPLSRFLEGVATADRFREFVMHRSAYQLKEADPHSWVIPRLRGPGKAALVEIQSDEYGGGRADRVHAELFAKTMHALGLDSTYGAYVGELPGITLATVNMISMFGLNRRWRGAAVGHLVAFESTSSEPNRRYGNGLRRLGFGDDACHFYDEHVEADSVHEVIAVYDLADALVRSEPRLAPDVLFGASALMAVEAEWAGYLLGRWERGESSLLAEAPTASKA